MPIKIENSKLLHFLESHIETTLDRPLGAAHIIDGNVILQGLTPIVDTNQYSTSYQRQSMLVLSLIYIHCISNSLESLTNVHTEE